MDALTALQTRHSTRSFKPDPIPRNVLEQIVDAGRLAATACNEQPWDFIVVTDAATRRKIADMTGYGKFIADAPACIVVTCKEWMYDLVDGAAASQNILVAATALGVQSCWVDGHKKEYWPPMAELLGMPAGHKVVSFLALGYEATAAPRAPKRALANVLHWEKF
jgi:nitroreductase